MHYASIICIVWSMTHHHCQGALCLYHATIRYMLRGKKHIKIYHIDNSY